MHHGFTVKIISYFIALMLLIAQNADALLLFRKYNDRCNARAEN
jgi:hypothetical protein